MRILEGLEPAAVMKYFEELCAIPHGSGNTGRIADYCERFAEEHSLECIRDEHNNIIIKKPKSAGSVSGETVIIQGHLDMVCAKTADCDIDLENEGLRLRTDGETVWAEGTTLGGDDAVAVAMALAVLDSEELVHPELECLFTSDEEIGMLGAAALDADLLKGRLLLNIDSEEEGVFTVSCAGGAAVEGLLPITRCSADRAASGKKYRITVSGLSGGHSGTEIDKGRENACIMLGRLLSELDARIGYELVSIDGGEKDNAIPRSAEAVVEADAQSGFEQALEELEEEYMMRFGLTETGLKIGYEECLEEREPMYASSKTAVLNMLAGMPNGVQSMSAEIKDLVQTSCNMGIVKTGDTGISLTVSVRSASDTEKRSLIDSIGLSITGSGGSFSVSGEYPAWEFKKDSKLRELASAAYVKQYGAEPEVSAIHAGLECGIFCGKLPGLDCISFGPNIYDIHTPAERLDIGSTARVYSFLTELLGMI